MRIFSARSLDPDCSLEQLPARELGSALARAFHSDPLQSYVLPDSHERSRLSASHFSVLAQVGWFCGEVWASDRDEGAAIWNLGADSKADELLRTLPDVLGPEPFLRFARVLDYLSAEHLPHCGAEDWYLMVLGVTPENQGRGLGTSLLEPVLHRADQVGRVCALDTAEEKNLRFYSRLGFHVAHESVDPASGLQFWTLRRQPSEEAL